MELMDYEKEILIDSFSDDGLLVMAKGLGIERILMTFIKLYCEPTNLVLVLNTVPQEEEYFRESLIGSDVSLLPRSINADVGINERQKMYPEGGVLFVTTRILVVDMLVERIPIGHITGIIINRAHKVIDSCQESFILRLYRQKNKTGFIKAFSENATAFAKGFCQIERVMKNLYLGSLHLWPRFRESVVEHFDNHKVDVVELHVPMTRTMIDCQTCIVNLIDGCLKEIKRCHALLDAEELSLEFALTKDFDKILRLQLDPIWHQLSQKTRQIVSDLRLLRSLLEELIQYDSVNFCNRVDALRLDAKNFNSNVGWLFTESADRLFKISRERIGISKTMPTCASHLTVEMNPKWEALKDALEEIELQADEYVPSSDDSSAANKVEVKVLVLSLNDKTCKQICEYLTNPKDFASKLGGNYQSLKRNQEAQITEPAEKRKRYVKKKLIFDAADEASNESTNQNVLTLMSNLSVCVHPIRDRDDPQDLNRKLDELQPHAIILYDAEVTAVRRIEVYRASRRAACTLRRVYFLLYSGSTEEQGYLTTLRKEKEAFEGLIQQKAVMVIPQEREGREEEEESETGSSTRKGGMATADDTIVKKVVVDMREFRSELPSLLHKRGISIEPITLEVGDYILTPDICVERKSVPDLVGSLNNGRLYNQCLAMCRTYKRPILLIEFNPNKPFTLQDKYPLSNEINSNDVMSRLALLTIHFPKLRILWCQSPHATAEMFEELKIGREEPNADAAAMVTSSSEDGNQSKHLDTYNSTPQDVLSKMPGVNSKNIFSIMNKVESLVQLTKLSLEELTDIMGSTSNATLLHQFLNTVPIDIDPKNDGTKKDLKSNEVASKNYKHGRQRFNLDKFVKKA